MSQGETTLTIVGHLTGDPELRFTPSGLAVCNFTVASNARIYDKATGEWKDGEPLFMRCNAWRDLAENITESLTRGSRVIVTGRLKSRSYETKTGEKRHVVEVDVEEVGPSLRWATAKTTKTTASSSGGGSASPSGPGRARRDDPADDPWAPPAGGGGYDGDPPF